jgi:hypothetical protein
MWETSNPADDLPNDDATGKTTVDFLAAVWIEDVPDRHNMLALHRRREDWLT